MLTFSYCSSAGLAVLNDKVYAVGGFDGSLRVRTVDVYDPAIDSWSTSCSMEARRSTLGMEQTAFHWIFQENLNFNYHVCLRCCCTQWTNLCCWRLWWSYRFVFHLDQKIQGKIKIFRFILGLSSAEVYDPKSNSWTLIESMSTRRSSVGVGVVHSELYAVGGYDGSCRECLSS